MLSTELRVIALHERARRGSLRCKGDSGVAGMSCFAEVQLICDGLFVQVLTHFAVFPGQPVGTEDGAGHVAGTDVEDCFGTIVGASGSSLLKCQDQQRNPAEIFAMAPHQISPGCPG